MASGDLKLCNGNERWERKFDSVFVAAYLKEIDYKGGLFWSGQKTNFKLLLVIDVM